mgnify:CR=1 FL=1
MCVVSSIISGVASIFQGAMNIYRTTEIIKYQQAQTGESIKAANQNAEIQRQNAIIERQESLEEARTQRLKTIQSMASEKALIASGNIDVNSQTSLDKLKTISAEGELDALNILNQGEKRAQRYLLQAQKYDSQANLILKQSSKGVKDTAFMLLGKGLATYQNAYNLGGGEL